MKQKPPRPVKEQGATKSPAMIVVREGSASFKCHANANRGSFLYTVAYYLGAKRKRRNFRRSEGCQKEAKQIAIKLRNGQLDVLTLRARRRPADSADAHLVVNPNCDNAVNTFLKMLFYTHALRRFDKRAEERRRDNLLILWAHEAQRFVTAASEDGMSDYNCIDVTREAQAMVVAAAQSSTSFVAPLGREKARVFYSISAPAHL